jgi:hypothetical protein
MACNRDLFTLLYLGYLTTLIQLQIFEGDAELKEAKW